MTLLTDIQAAQSQVLLPFVNKPLLVRTPLEVIEAFNPNHYDLWLFDPTNYGDSADYVYLRLFPKYESPIDPADRGYFPTFNGTATRHATTRRTFTATINQQQGWIFKVIERLAAIADTSSYTVHTPIKIIDFCSPEAEDDTGTTEYGGELGTIRYGRIDIEKRPEIIRGVLMNYCRGEWNFKFTEAILRN